MLTSAAQAIGIRLRWPWFAAVGGAAIVAIMAVALRGAGVTPLRIDPVFEANAAITVNDLGSPAGRDAVTLFNNLGPDPLTIDDGFAAFAVVTWSADKKPAPSCQVQLALKVPSTWQLFGWAGDPQLTNGTINSWGLVQEGHKELRDVQVTIVLPGQADGVAMLAWRVTGESDPATVTGAYLAYACGNADTASKVYPVRVQVK